MSAVRQWRSFALELTQVFEDQGGQSDSAYLGARRMADLAEQCLALLGDDTATT